MKRWEKFARGVGVLACQIFAVVTFFMLLSGKQYDRLLLAAGTVILALVPEMMERLFRYRISTPFYLFCLFYAIGPMLGHCHNLYYLLPGWDKMLHIFGGVVFAVLGIHLFGRFAGEGRKKIFFGALFALCFSMAVSVLWEFVEFAADRLFPVDMQSDTVIDSILSYSLGNGLGVAGTFENITSVMVNGEALPIAGYLDIGLMDTMWDMLLETIGGLAAAVFYLIDKGRHSVLMPREKGKPK